jgi:hypothetical protein
MEGKATASGSLAAGDEPVRKPSASALRSNAPRNERLAAKHFLLWIHEYRLGRSPRSPSRTSLRVLPTPAFDAPLSLSDPGKDGTPGRGRVTPLFR